MASQDQAIEREHPSWRGSKRIASIEPEDEIVPATNVGEDPKRQEPRWRKFLAYVGPGFLVAMAYIDPGNLETDLQAGATYKFELLWVILIGMIFALIIQSLAANLGVTTGKHLAELCKAEYPKYVKYCLWLSAETAVIAADIPEVVGTAFALNILFHIPTWAGVLLTGTSTLLLLGLQRYGIRKLELLMACLVCTMACCYFVEMGYVKPPPKEVLKGLFIPKVNGNGAMGNVIALLGAIITPHNLFLHSALVLTRKTSQSVDGINSVCRYFLIETGFTLFVALLINVAVAAVSGTVCFADNLSQENANKCNNLTLDSASFLLKNVLGKSSSTIYAIALLASGQSSTITGTYAGQFIMQGFLDLKMKKWMANFMTRFIAIAPSLIVSIISGPAGAGQLIIIASMILSFDLPFILIPLLKFSSSKAKMGQHKNSIYIMTISWLLGLGTIGINVYYLSTGFVGWLIHNNLPKIGNIFIGLIVFPLMAVYILAIIYLAFRKDTAVTFIHTTPTLHSSSQTQMENGEFNPNDNSHGMADVPYREDLADIPLPQ